MLAADDAELHADGADMTRLVFKITDKYGNRLPLCLHGVIRSRSRARAN